MKKFVLTALCALVSVSAFAQGTIQLSNIGKGIVSIDGAAAGPGSATVQYADANDNLVGGTASILGAGFFSGGSRGEDSKKYPSAEDQKWRILERILERSRVWRISS